MKGRIIAIDFGKVRTGLAVTDAYQMIASGLTTVETKTVIAYLQNYCKEEQVVAFVVGEPKQLDNTASESESLILPFIGRLKHAIPEIPIHRFDERFTSKMAFQTMIDSGLKKKQRQNKALVDEISATIILQSYLDSKN